MAKDDSSGGYVLSIPGRGRIFRGARVRPMGSRYQMRIGNAWVTMRETSLPVRNIRAGKWKLKGVG